MFVIVEGVDRVGKTTLCDKLVNLGFIKLKDKFISGTPNAQFSAGKLDTAVSYIKQLNDLGYNIVADRLHLTELVYGTIERNNVEITAITKLDYEIQKMFGADVLLAYVTPLDIKWSSNADGRDLSKYSDFFKECVYNSTINKKYSGNCNSFDLFVDTIMHETSKYDFYFASPFFNPEQVEREERLKQHLRTLGYKVLSPKESCKLDCNAAPSLQSDVFKSNCESIKHSTAVFAITDGKDMGTVWEAGYAFALGKPVVYYAETLGNKPFNLMLAKSGRAIFTNQIDLTRLALTQAVYSFSHDIYGGTIE